MMEWTYEGFPKETGWYLVRERRGRPHCLWWGTRSVDWRLNNSRIDAQCWMGPIPAPRADEPRF